MPTTNLRPLGMAGMGDLSLSPLSLNDQWQDSDKARVNANGELRAWPGYMRKGVKLSTAAGFPSGNQIAVVAASQEFINKREGHLLAAVDCSPGTPGRVMAIAHQDAGLLGSDSFLSPTVLGVLERVSPHDYPFMVGSNGKVVIGHGYATPLLENGTALESAGLRAPQIKPIPSIATVNQSIAHNTYTDASGSSDIGHTTVSPTTWIATATGVKLKTQAITDPQLVAGGGLSDLSVQGTFDGTSPATYAVGIFLITPTEDYFSWSRDGGQTWAVSNTPIMNGWNNLEHGLQIKFSQATGHTSGIVWLIKIRSAPYLDIQYPSGFGTTEFTDVAYINNAGSIPADASSITVQIILASLASSALAPANSLSLVFCTETDMRGTQTILVIPNQIYGSSWTSITVPWTAGLINYASIGLRLNTSLGSPLEIGIFDIYVNPPAGGSSPIPTSTLFAGNVPWQFVFTWLETTGRKRESYPSPVSDAITLNGAGLNMDISGDYPGIDAGLANSPPESSVDAIHIYGFTPTLGTDPRFGGGQFFRITPDGGLPISSLMGIPTMSVTTNGANTGTGTLINPMVHGGLPAQTFTITMTGVGEYATGFTVVGSVSGSLPNGDVTEIPIINYTTADGSVSFQITPGYHTLIPGDSFTIVYEPVIGYSTTIISPVDMSTIIQQPLAPWYLRQLQGFDLAVSDGDLIVLASQPPYQVGQWTFTAGSNVVTPYASQSTPTASVPIIGQWMQDRTIRVYGSTKTYRIVKCLDQNGDGILDALWVAESWNPDQNLWYGSFAETGGVFSGIIEGDQVSIYWTNNTSERGIDLETCSPLSSFPITTSGDSIVALFKVGEFVWVGGKHEFYVLQQNAGALTDNPQNGMSYANPAHLPGTGIMGKRWWAHIGGGSVAFLSGRAELMIGTADGNIQKHAASDKIQALLSGWGYLTDTRQFANGFMDFVQSGQGKFLYLGLIGGGQYFANGDDVAPGVRRQATDIWNNENPNIVSTGSPVPPFWDPLDFSQGAYCPPQASYNNTARLVPDFQIGVLVDMNSGLVSLGSACRFTCAGVRPADECTGAAQAPGPNFFGDLDGYVDQVFDDKLLSWGSPSARFVWPQAGGSADTFQVGRTLGGIDDAASLAVDGSGNGLLAGLVCAKVPGSSTGNIEYRRIVSNTVDTVTVGQNWTVNPVAGDMLIVGPLAFLVHFAEIQLPRPVVFRLLRAFYNHAGIATAADWHERFSPRMLLEQFIADGRGMSVTSLTPAASKAFDGGEFSKGTGAVHFSGRSAKAQSLRLTVLQGDDAPVVLSQLNVEERG